MPSPVGPRITRDHYRELLKSNFIWCPANVMYRRTVFRDVGLFDRSLRSAEDYDMYLRIARRFLVRTHAGIVAEYRFHRLAMSRNSGRMLRFSVRVLRAQRRHVSGDRDLEAACESGIHAYQKFYGIPLIKQIAQRTCEDDGGGSSFRRVSWRFGITRGLSFYPRAFTDHTNGFTERSWECSPDGRRNSASQEDLRTQVTGRLAHHGRHLHVEPIAIAPADARGLYRTRCSDRHEMGAAGRQQQLHGRDRRRHSCFRRLPARTQGFESRPGLSHARNRAIAEATGDYILWTDDDVTVCRDWLVAYADAFRKWPDAVGFGGPSGPRSTERHRRGCSRSIPQSPESMRPAISGRSRFRSLRTSYPGAPTMSSAHASRPTTHTTRPRIPAWQVDWVGRNRGHPGTAGGRSTRLVGAQRGAAPSHPESTSDHEVPAHRFLQPRD